MVKILTERRRKDMMTQGVRDLFAAGWLGEQMFAQLGLHRAVTVLDDPRERSKVIGRAWHAERPFGRAVEVGLAGAALLDFVRDLRGRRWFDLAASSCALAAVATAIGNEISGRVVGEDTPIESGFRAHRDAPPSARTAQTVIKVLAPIGLGLAMASIGLSIASRFVDD